MRRSMRTIGISLILGGLAAAAPAYAHEQKQPSMNSGMMKGGGMDGMMGMMGMMEQMNKMMGLCTKMMESSMDGKDSSDMKKPMESPTEPGKKG